MNKAEAESDLKLRAIFFSESDPCQVTLSVPIEKQRAAKWVFTVYKSCESVTKVRRRFSSCVQANMVEA